MSFHHIFDIAGSGMRAQNTRLNVTASNMANAQSVASSPEEAYRARQPVFQAMLEDSIGGVKTRGITTSTREPEKRYAPDHSLADDEGYIYVSNVDPIEEMANMMSASRSYQSNVDLMNTSRQLMLQTLKLAE